jgi:hypothetical protein
VTIELSAYHEKSLDLMMGVYNKAVLPLVEDLRLRVQDVKVKYPPSWELGGSAFGMVSWALAGDHRID